ncbi:MAG: hypothetical protein R3F29_07160 [Planctomycetota bacterium]
MHRSAVRRLVLSLTLVPALAGCTYLDQRMADLHDAFVYRFHDDVLGVAADAKVGPLGLVVGGWYAAQPGWGKDSWWQRPGSTMTNHGTGVPFTTLGPLGYGQSWSRLFATGTSGNHPGEPQAFDDVTSWLLLTDTFDLDDNYPFQLTAGQRIVDLFGVEVGVAPLFWEVHVGFNAAEFVDFLLGMVLIDVFGDDGVPRPPTVHMVVPPDDGRRRR